MKEQRNITQTGFQKKSLLGVLAGGILLAAGAVVSGRIWLPRKERPKGSGPRIVCIGDSITFGAGVVLTRHFDSWVRILGKKLKGKYEVLNYGISGATLLREGDQPYDPGFWKAAKALQAQIYLLMLGTNDSKPQNWNAEKYEQQLSERIQELKNETFPKHIILMAPPPAFKKVPSDHYAVYNIDGEVLSRKIRGIVKKCAMGNGVDSIDLYEAMAGHPEYMKDGVHPNKLGNEVIAETVLKALINL